MPLSVESLKNKHRTTTIDFEGDQLTVTFHSPTIAQMEDFSTQAANDGTGGAASGTKFLSEMLVSWDLTLGGAPYPIDFDSLRELNADFIAAVMNGVTEAAKPSPKASQT